MAVDQVASDVLDGIHDLIQQSKREYVERRERQRREEREDEEPHERVSISVMKCIIRSSTQKFVFDNRPTRKDIRGIL